MRLPRLLFQREGALGAELRRGPAGGTLGLLPERLMPQAITRTVCGFCSTGCGLDVHLRDGQAVSLSPDPTYPVNLGKACPKGWEALAPLRAADRLTAPLLRGDDGTLARTDWTTALKVFVRRLKAIIERDGPEAVAFLSTGQIPTEEMALLGALAKFGMGLVHGDGNTRQCMATAAVAYKQSFGFDAPPYTYADFEESDVIVLVGSNLCVAHPIMWERIVRNRHKPEIVVVDPRRTETANAATQHIALAPKSDLTLFYGLANLLIQRGATDDRFIRDHTTGFERFAAFTSPFTIDRVARESGVPRPAVEKLAATIASGKRVSFWWTMGVNQSHEGVRLAQAIINLALLTGNIGRPGTGANSITGQCNAMGSRLFSNTTSLLGGHDFANEEHRARVARAIRIDAITIPRTAGWAYDQILEAVGAGKIKALWIIGTNPRDSWIDQVALRAAMSRLEFLVVQDIYSSTDTATSADLVLPAAAWGEKDGTFINSERRIGLVKKVAPAPGNALADFYIFKLIADAWGCGEMFDRWTTPEAVFAILATVTRGQPCDISGITGYAMIESMRGVQWPVPGETPVNPAAERRLFEDHRFFHKDGRARFIFDPPSPPAEVISDDYPFVLLTGRGGSSQWHTETRTSKSGVLRKLAAGGPYVEINTEDAARLGIAGHSWVIVESRRGEMRAQAHVGYTVQPGQVFIPMHAAETNRLTFASFDPHSRQPSYKHCAVRLRAE